MDYTSLEKQYHKLLHLNDDPDIVAVMYACVLANRIDGDPVWLIVTGPSGSGKTELLFSLQKANEIIVRSTLEPKALASGYGDLRENSLLFQLDKKVLVIEDFSATNSQYAEAKSQLMGMLRMAYNGAYSRPTGRGEIIWKGKFGMLCGSTLGPDGDNVMNNMLGERFLYFRSLVRDSDELMARVQSHVVGNTKTTLREDLQVQAANFLNDFQLPGKLLLPKATKAEIVEIARALVRCRTGVIRNRNKEIDSPAEQTELPTRVTTQLTMVAKVLYALGVTQDRVSRILCRFFFDCMPRTRSRVLQAMAGGAKQSGPIAKAAGMSRSPADRVLEELELFDIVRRNMGSEWEITNPFVAQSVATMATLLPRGAC